MTAWLSSVTGGKTWRMIGNSSVYRFNIGMGTHSDLVILSW